MIDLVSARRAAARRRVADLTWPHAYDDALVTDRPRLSHVFAFTEQREAVARFYEDVLGLDRERPHADSAWFTTEGARFVVHDRRDEPSSSGFVPWFHVADLDAAFTRADAAGSVVGGMRDGYFFMRDPDGRVVGVRRAIRERP